MEDAFLKRNVPGKWSEGITGEERDETDSYEK